MFLQSKCEKWLKHEKVQKLAHAHMHTPHTSKDDRFITAVEMILCEWTVCEIMSKIDFKSNRTTLLRLHEVVQRYLEMISYLQEVLQQKKRDIC